MKKVLIPTKLDDVCRAVLEDHGGYDVVHDAAAGLDGLAAAHPDAYALVVRSEPVTAAVIEALPSLKVIVRAGAGYNTIDTKHARARGVDVMNTPGANSNAVAEEVVALILADIRHIIRGDQSTRAGEWEKSALMGRELAGKTVGIVGLGHIGQLVARRMSGFDVNLLGVDPFISRERAAALDVEMVSLEELFAASDFITLHIPENTETRGIVGAGLLEQARPGVTIVNCARAGIVDEDALREAKATKGLRYLNDVYPKDEAGPKSIADVADIMLPHLGASTHEANANAARRAAEELIEFDDKGVTSYIVNREIPDGLDEAYCELANLLARLCRCITGNGATLKMIETSFYGDLEPYMNWLMVPVVAGIWEDFDRSMDYKGALAFLESRGITYRNRAVDPDKPYGNAMTVDVISSVGSDSLRRVSVRGTTAEGRLMISRINDFDALYFEPTGPTVFFIYEDRPGVLGQIGVALADAGINIEDVRNPHDRRTGKSLATMKVSKSPTPEQVRKIAEQIQALSAFSITF